MAPAALNTTFAAKGWRFAVRGVGLGLGSVMVVVVDQGFRLRCRFLRRLCPCFRRLRLYLCRLRLRKLLLLLPLQQTSVQQADAVPMATVRRVRVVDLGGVAQVMGGVGMVQMITARCCGVVRSSLGFVLVR